MKTKYHLIIIFNDGEQEEYFTNHLNIENLMSSKYLKDIKTININN